MDRPFNFWDLLIGMGYGMFVSVLILRIMGLVPVNIMIVFQILWLATLCLQIVRTLKQRQTPETSVSKSAMAQRGLRPDERKR